MVGMMFTSSREEAASHLNSFKCAMDIASKLEYLRRLKEVLLHKDPSLLPDFVHRLAELQADRFSPIRKALAEFFGEIGLVCVDFVPEIVPILISWLNDDTPAVARQAIASGTHLFRGILEKVAIQGLHSSDLDESLRSSWGWMLKFKDILCPIAFQPGRDGIRLLAVKFVEAMVLLYSPDPSASSESPDLHACNGRIEGFNISWVKGGHPLLKLGDLSIEAGQSLDSLLDLLRFPKVKSLSNSMMIVLINSLSTIAKKRPAFYGRILPVLLGLDPPISVIKGVHFTGVHHVLKSSFLSCLKCTHQGAVPWRDRLLGALKDLKAGNFAEQDVHQDCGSKEDGVGEGYVAKEVKLSIETFDPIEVDTGRKRSAIQQTDDLVENDGAQGKRYRSTLVVSEDSDRITDLGQVGVPVIGSKSSSVDVDTGPVQQLVAMFGALVAQGEKAVGSLEILISSISSDLLAEVVIANMRYLPSSRPGAEEDEERTVDEVSLSSVVGSKILAMRSTSLSSEISALSGVLPQLASLFGAQPLATCGVTHREGEYPAVTIHDTGSVLAGINDVTDAIGSSAVLVTSADNDDRSILSDSNLGIEESEIPGLDSTMHTDRTVETFDTTQMASSAVSEERNQEVLTSLDEQDIPSSGSLPTDRSEELSPSLAVSDANSVASVTAVVLSSQYVLPKMSAPVVDLTDDQKDELQKTAFIRIIESYKQMSVAGGSCLRFSLLAYLAVKYPLELDPWKCLQEHVLSDYSNHEGHELTLRVLYRLFGEAEQEHDFFSSTAATSVYETFLLIVAETLRDSFPASDKSLSRLFNEAPYLPKSAFKLLECLCSPGKSEKADKELQGGDRVTQGLSAVWSLILLRPPIRDVCLKIALQSAVHHMEEVRMKAIRLVANKLYPIPCITQQIEDFASEMLHSVLKSHAMEGMDTDGSTLEAGKVSDLGGPFNAQALSLTTQKEVSSDNHLPSSAPTTSSSLISESQRCMSLYFALCTKKHSLFRQIFVIYKSIPKAVIQAVHRHIPILVRTIGSSPELLAIISDPPDGCESLLMQVLHILTEGTIPSPELVSAVRRLYDLKLKDVEILIPVLSSLPKEEISSIFPKLVNLPLDKFQVALTHVLQGSSHSGPVLTPAEVLIAVNGIDPDKDGIPLKKVTDACNACFEQRHLFTQQVLAKVLNQLVEQTPLPLLFMRTVLQAIGAFPALVDFIMEILSRLVTKQIWRYPKLWVGFLKCTLLTKPQSFSVLLQLPAAQLENALNRNPALKAPLAAHANQPNIRSSLPRSSLVVLGIATDSHISSQSQTSAALMDTTNSGSNGAKETAKESSTAS